MPTVFVMPPAFALVARASGHELREYLHIRIYAMRAGAVIVCTAIVGAGLEFLWFNTYPARTWATRRIAGVGRRVGRIAVLLRQEFLLVIMGGVFVVEICRSSQVGSFKLRGRRIFRMAYHHHYELKGWRNRARDCALLDYFADAGADWLATLKVR